MNTSDKSTAFANTDKEKPAMEAAKLLGGLIAGCRQDDAHRARAEVDLRAVEDIQRKLQSNPEDASARLWVRQLTQTWSFRVRDNSRSIRRILDLLDGSGTGGRR
jgi:hypothetical protein